MRIFLAIAPLALLAACGSGAGNKAGNAANGAAPAANATAPAANTAAPSSNATASADPRRANEIQECVADVRNEVAEGTDVDAFCGCAVDRMQSGGERDAMEACAAQMGIRRRIR